MAKAKSESAKEVTYNPDIYDQAPPEKHDLMKTEKFFSSAFKLTVAKVLKRVGLASHPNDEPTDFYPFEHTHIFRTRDSEGRKQSHSASIGGHFHVVEMEAHPEGEDKPPIIKSISGPMVMGRKKVKGRWQSAPTPLNDYDDHTHKVVYINTDEITARKKNVVTAMVEAEEARKGMAPLGASEM